MDNKNFLVEYTVSDCPEDVLDIMGRLIHSRLKEHQDYIDHNIMLGMTPTSITVAVFPEELKAEIPAFLKDHTAFKTWWDVTLSTVYDFFGKEEENG